MADRLAYLQRLMQKQGLRRTQVERDMVWRWQRFPGLNWTLEWEMGQ